MRYVFVFLCLPILLLATESYDPSKSDFVDPEFYKNKLQIDLFEDGHLWIPVMFQHSDQCPCHLAN